MHSLTVDCDSFQNKKKLIVRETCVDVEVTGSEAMFDKIFCHI